MSDARLYDHAAWIGADALGGDQDDDVAAATARSAPLTAEPAERLAAHPHAGVREALAANPTTPPDVLASLVRPGGQPPAQRCAGCVGEPDEAGPWCGGRHEDAVFLIHRAAADNSATPPEIIQLLLGHPDMWVRCAVAARADLPPDAHRRLAEDQTPGVRGALAQNPAIGEPLMRTIATDARTRRRLAHNPALPLDLLIELARVADLGATLLPRIAAATPDEVSLLAAAPVAAVRLLLAQRPDLPADVVERLAADPTPGMPAAIAAQHNASVPVLLRCLADPQARPIAARHPALPPDRIAELLTDPDQQVAEAAAANPSLPNDDTTHPSDPGVRPTGPDLGD